MKKISILIVAYNSERFIEKTLKSCMNQTYDNYEILILDNASHDNTVKIIESIKNEKVKLFSGKENIGSYAGLNFLLEKAEGDYIAIQDHDDIWFPEKIEKQADFLEKNQDFIACGTDVYYFFEAKELLILKKFKKDVDYVNHTSLMFRNIDFRYNTSIFFPDEYFEKIILREKGKIGCLLEELTIHRIRSDGKNLSKIRSQKKLSLAIGILKRDGFSKESIKYASYLLFRNFFPDNVLWLIRKNMTMRNYNWISKDEFIKKFPVVKL